MDHDKPLRDFMEDSQQTNHFTKLIQRVLQGEELAASELVRLYEPELRRVIRFRLTRPNLRRFLDSLDICQSVLAVLFNRLQTGELELNHPEQLRQLLRMMAEHKIIDKVREQQAQRRGGKATPQQLIGDEAADSATDPAKMFEVTDLVEAVRMRLNEKERRLLDRWMEGQEWKEIAGKGASPEALRKKLSRAIDSAARELGLIEEKT